MYSRECVFVCELWPFRAYGRETFVGTAAIVVRTFVFVPSPCTSDCDLMCMCVRMCSSARRLCACERVDCAAGCGIAQHAMNARRSDFYVFLGYVA